MDSSFDINNRMHPASPTSKRPNIALLIGCVIPLVMIIVGIIWMITGGAVKLGILPTLPRAMVNVGSPMKWIEVTKYSDQHYSPLTLALKEEFLTRDNLCAGDADGDGIDELLHWLPGPDSINIDVYNLRGMVKSFKIPAIQYIVDIVVLDVTGDGIVEICVGELNGSVTYYDLDGRKLMEHPGELAAIGDIDGDGIADVLTFDPYDLDAPPLLNDQGIEIHCHSGPCPHHEVTAYNSKGNVIWKYAFDEYVSEAVLGDIDGDGMDELIISDLFDGGYAVGLTQQRIYLHLAMQSCWSDNKEFLVSDSAGCSYDLTGDGIDEVIVSATNGYFDLTREQPTATLFQTLTLPRLGQNVKKGTRLVVGDYDQDGEIDIAITLGFMTGWCHFADSTGLYVLNRDGEIKFYEEFGEPVLDIVTMEDGDRDRLAILTATKLLVSP